MVKVSVIIPNYNRETLVGDTIENMLRQSLPPHEVIVVDDGSTDNSVSVIKKFGNRVTLIEQTNQGPSAARNLGLKVASGDFIQFMDSDDLASLNKLEVQARVLQEQEADIVYGAWTKAWLTNGQVKLQDVVLQQAPLPSHQHPLFWFLTSWSMVFQQCLVRKSLLDRIGGYREDLRLYEDGELFVRMLLAGAKLVHESETLTLYRLEDHGKLTASGSQQHRKILDKARFHILIANLLKQEPAFSKILTHPEFRANAWSSLKDLEKFPNNSDSLSHSLKDFLGQENLLLLSIINWLRQKSKGIQYRLKGHRWSHGYQAYPLTAKQQKLIEKLGFSVS
ncbi:MAG: glycosyltransferase [Moorea sp. SIOASIH]|uniref:glycosyltransferase family 2 protein n=1 Tax=Moorena sp. SIOASIH TaxID=2607817 RepID=UPI0013B70E64|nr:glycosyltransferase [Moorena sp. SIOASIH]NEO36150.1 glycosyltransferase [Moorena sp. SIOASIH]